MAVPKMSRLRADPPYDCCLSPGNNCVILDILKKNALIPVKFFVSFEERDYYLVISAGQFSFDCRSLRAQPPYASKEKKKHGKL